LAISYYGLSPERAKELFYLQRKLEKGRNYAIYG